MKQTLFVLMFALACSAYAADEPAKETGPCKQIAKACTDAGFIKGDWKKGDGLFRDCVAPIMQGVSTVPGATKPLPTVDAKLIADCKAKHPKYGSGKIGSVVEKKPKLKKK